MHRKIEQAYAKEKLKIHEKSLRQIPWFTRPANPITCHRIRVIIGCWGQLRRN